MRQRVKKHEILLMLLPVTALAGLGFYAGTRHQEVESDGPFRLVAAVKRVPVTPHHVAQGYDSTFRVVLSCRSQRPQNWGEPRGWGFSSPSVFYLKNGKRIYLDAVPPGHVSTHVGFDMAHFDPADLTYNTDLSFDLGHVPVSYGEIRYETTIGYESYRNGKTIPERRRTPLSLILRKTGEIIPRPVVSKYCPLSLTKVAVQDYLSAPLKECIVTVVIHSLEPIAASAPDGSSLAVATHLEDSSGKRYGTEAGWTSNIEGNDCTLSWNILKRHIPTVPGPVTFKSQVSLADGWPLPIAVVIRKK